MDNGMFVDVDVVFGDAWYKLVGASLCLGGVVSIGSYLIGRMVFKDTFNRTTVTRSKEL